jgi:hypothetical protein
MLMGAAANGHSLDFGAFVGLLFVFGLYFAPALSANLGNHRNRVAIFVFNLFLGWTILGWILALVWSFTNNREAVA